MEKALLVWCVIVLAGVYGWVNNIITLFGMSDVWAGEGVLRVAGIFMVLLGRFWGTSNMKDLHTNRYPRKHKDEYKLASLLGTGFGLAVVGAYFGFILYILCFIHQLAY